MIVHLIRRIASDKELEEMLDAFGTFIKLAVDVRKGVLAGGGEFHADCEEVLLDHGSEQADVWGADWTPANQEVAFEALINIRPRQGNRSMLIQDEKIKQGVESTARALLARK